MGVGVKAAAGETPSLTGEFVRETRRVLECTQTHPPWNQNQKGPICLWVAGEMTESWQRAKQVTLFPLNPPPQTASQRNDKGCLALVNTQGPAPYYITGKPRPKTKKTQMKEQIKAPEKIQLSDGEIVSLSDAQFKTLVIRMLTEMVEFGHKLDEKMKAMLSEIKENIQGTNSDRKEPGTPINGVDQKEERNTQPEKNEETRIQINEERLRNLQDILKHSNI